VAVQNTIQNQVVSAIDGSLITVLRDKEQIVSRLSGIDASEKLQTFSNVPK
jgi:hypothetical protein